MSCMNPVLYFDELDKVCSSRHGDEVSNCLIHLTDPEQNKMFRDRYLGDVDIDLSACVMVFSFNDASKINPVLLDRLHVVRMNEYGREDKGEIARSFLLPELASDIRGDAAEPMPEDVLDRFIDEFSAGTGGMRSLKHALERACLKKNAMGALRVTEEPREVTWQEVLDSMVEERDEELTRGSDGGRRSALARARDEGEEAATPPPSGTAGSVAKGGRRRPGGPIGGSHRCASESDDAVPETACTAGSGKANDSSPVPARGEDGGGASLAPGEPNRGGKVPARSACSKYARWIALRCWPTRSRELSAGEPTKRSMSSRLGR